MATKGNVLWQVDNTIKAANGALVGNNRTVVAGIDLLATGQTTLLAAVTGKKFLPQQVILELTSVTGVLTGTVVRVGQTASWDQIAPLYTVLLTAADTFVVVPLVGTLATIDIGTNPIKIDVQTAGTVATVAVARIHLSGIIV